MSQPMCHRSVISALFLVAGTCIGGGMLALPLATGIGGLLPSLIVMTMTWVMMTVSALCLLEACLWMEEGVHLITMVTRILGPVGKWLSWFLYIFICYASLIAYTAGSGHWVASIFNTLLGLSLTKELGCLLFILIFGAVVYIGSTFLGRVNSILFVAMIVSYISLATFGLSEVRPTFLSYSHWKAALVPIPLMLTAFSFQTMVPSLVPYLKKHVRSLRWAILGGTILTFVIYALWQVVILGIIPVDGEFGLTAAYIKGDRPVTEFLQQHLQNQWIAPLANYFAFFAIVTSFLGIAFGLFDFLSDGLQIRKEGWRKLFLAALIALPTLFFAITYERAFLVALDISGGMGDSILNGLIPIALVWVGRYSMHFTSLFKVWGGKPFLAFVALFFVFTVVVEILLQCGYLTGH